MNYDYTNKERQRRYTNRMRKAGLKKIGMWIKKNEPKSIQMNIGQFVKELRKLTDGWDTKKLSLLLNLYISIAKSKKEVK